MSNYLTNIYQTLRDHTKYFDITGLLLLMLCTAEMTYEYELYSILLVDIKTRVNTSITSIAG
jgi:hypothetical protein